MLDPDFQEVRSPNFQMVVLRCVVIKANPTRIASVRWFQNGKPVGPPIMDSQDTPVYRFRLEPDKNGTYECRVSNNAGTSSCTYNVSGESHDMNLRERCFVPGLADYFPPVIPG